MYNTTAEIDNIIRGSCRKFEAKIEIEEKEITSVKSLKISRGLISGDTLNIGCTVSSSAEVIVSKLDFFATGKTAKVYFKINNTEIPMGVFKITKSVTKSSLTTLSMSDILSTEAEKIYVSDLQYPVSATAVVNEICTKLKIRMDTTLENLQVKSKPEGYTIREVIGYIACKYGKNAVITREGNLAFKWFDDNGYELNADYAGEPEIQNEEIVINSLTVNTEKNVKYTKGNGQVEVIANNPLMLQTDMDIAFNTINGFLYTATDIAMPLGDPRLDPWDIVSYKTFKIPCMNIELEYDGGIKATIKSIGKAEPEAEYDYKGPVTKAMDRYYAELVLVNKAVVNKLDAEEAEMTYATITELKVLDKAVLNKLSAEEADIKYATLKDFNAEKGRVDDLEANALTANSAVITELTSNAAEINTLLFGSASGGSLTTEFSNTVVGLIGEAQIKDAMIENITVNKILAGDISTNKFRIISDSGNTLLADNTMQISDGTHTRVQIGKDAAGDYNIYIWDKNGKLMFDPLYGVQADGIKQAIIRNDMVSDNANISAKKLDINTLFTEINGSTQTIKSNKIYVDADGQTLDVAFKTMQTNVNGLEENITTQGTQLTVIQGQISSKIWQQDIKEEFDNLEIGGRNLVPGTEKWTGDWLDKSKVEITGNVASVPLMTSPKYTPFEIISGENITIGIDISSNATYIHDNEYAPVLLDWLDGNNVRVSYTWVFKNIEITEGWKRFSMSVVVPEGVEKLSIGLRSTNGYVNKFRFLKVEKGNKATDWTPAPEDIEDDINLVNTTLTNKYTTLEQTVTGLTATVSSNTTEIKKKADGSTVTELQTNLTSLTANLDGFKTEVSSTYTTKTDFENLEIGGTNILRNYSKYTEDNKLKVTATKDNYTAITSARVTLKEGKQYTFSCKTDGIWGTGLDDTVEAYLLLDGKYDTYFRMETNEGFIFTAPASGEYYLRIDVNKNGMIHYFWNFKIEEGNKATTWSPCPNDVDSQITSISTIATQTADKFNWLVKSGTSSSDFTITDRLISLTSQALNINALTTFMNSAKDGSSTVINGSAITAGRISSNNWVPDDGQSAGCSLNLDRGSFWSKYLQWDEYGQLTCMSANIKGNIAADSGNIGRWRIDNGGMYKTFTTGTTPGNEYTTYVQCAVNADQMDITPIIGATITPIDSSGKYGKTETMWSISSYGDIETTGYISTTNIIKFSNGHIDGTKTDYLYIHASKAYADIQVNTAVRAVNSDSTGYKPMHASAFTVNSREEYKQDIKPLDVDKALKIIKNADIYKYKLKEDVKCGEPKEKYGCIIGNGYNTPFELMNYAKTGMETADMLGIAYKVIQYNLSVSENNAKRIEELENELKVAKALIQSLQAV